MVEEDVHATELETPQEQGRGKDISYKSTRPVLARKTSPHISSNIPVPPYRLNQICQESALILQVFTHEGEREILLLELYLPYDSKISGELVLSTLIHKIYQQSGSTLIFFNH